MTVLQQNLKDKLLHLCYSIYKEQAIILITLYYEGKITKTEFKLLIRMCLSDSKATPTMEILIDLMEENKPN